MGSWLVNAWRNSTSAIIEKVECRAKCRWGYKSCSEVYWAGIPAGCKALEHELILLPISPSSKVVAGIDRMAAL